MSILNVNQIQPVGSGQTVTISATNISAGSATVTAGTFTGNLTGNVTGNATGLSGSPTLSGITSVSTSNLTVNGNAYPNGGPLSSRNKLINGNFDVWQRGTSFTSTVSGTSGYTADRWKAGGGTSTTVSRQSFTLGQTDVPGEPTYYAQWALTNNSQNYEFHQRIEDVRTLAGKQATISFYARRTTGTVTVGVRTVQYFGTGGSPSSSVIVSAGAPSLTSSWQKFTYTVDIASISGKTLGSDNNHSLWVGFQISDTNTGTIEIAQFQLEEGSVATPFEHRSYGDELLRCQRYCYAAVADGSIDNYAPLANGRFYNTSDAQFNIFFPVTMRTPPTLDSATTAAGTFFYNTGGGFGGVEVTTIALNERAYNSATVYAQGASGQTAGNGTTLYSHDTEVAKLIFTAEL
jgi:hypothetical protein